MLSSSFNKIVKQQFARSIYKPHLRRYFKKSQDNLFKAKQGIQKKLSVEPMPQNLFKKVFKQTPKIFVDKTLPNQRYENRIKLIKDLSQKYQLAKCMLNCLYKNQYLLFKMTDQQVQNICKAVQQNYGFTSEQIKTIFSNYYRTINPKLLIMLDQKIELFYDYLQISKEDTVRLFVKHHFLIPASTDRIRQTILLLLSKSKTVGDKILSKQRIIQFLGEYPEIFILGRHQIIDLINIYKSWGLQQEEVWQIILQNPLLLNNFPFEVMPLKKKLFRYFKFTKEMGRLMVKKYPLVLLSSISSLQAKLIFIKQRLKLPINQQTLELLQFKFSQIRPRGQLLVRAKQNYTLDNIIEDYIKINDEQFAKKLDIPLTRLQEEKQRFKQTEQLDFRRRKVLKGAGIQEKIKGLVSQLRAELPRAALV